MFRVEGIEAIGAWQEYSTILQHRLANPLPEGEYGEVHHAVPRCCNGGNDDSNLVKLTPEEHYRCHELLPFIYQSSPEHDKLLYGWNVMSNTHKGIKVDVRLYGRLKREYSNMRTGKHLSEETKRKMSEAQKGRAHTEEHNRRVSEAKRTRLQVDTEYRKQLSDRCNANSRMLSQRYLEDPDYHQRCVDHLNEIIEGNKGKHHSEEWRRKISEGRKRHDLEHPETLEKIREVLHRNHQKMKGTHQTEESNRKRSEALKLYWERKRQNESLENE